MFDKLLKKFHSSGKVSNHTFTDVDRETAEEMRRLRSELRRTRSLADMKMELKDLRKLMFDDGEGGDSKGGGLEDQLLTQLMQGIFSKMNNTTSQTETIVNILTDDQIRDIIKGFTKSQLKMAKKLDDQTLGSLIASKMPALSPESINKALLILREEF